MDCSEVECDKWSVISQVHVPPSYHTEGIDDRTSYPNERIQQRVCHCRNSCEYPSREGFYDKIATNQNDHENELPSFPAPPKQKRKKFSSEMVNVVEVRARRILLKPTPEQAQILRKWFDGARFAYNHALELCEAVPEARSLQSLRSYVVATDLLPPEWAYSPSFFSY